MQKSDQSAIFNIFHDGTFLSVQREADDIVFRIEIQYLAAMIDPAYSYFTGIFKNCRQFLLQLWGEDKKCYEDIDRISMLLMNMEISRSIFENTQVVVHCLSEEEEHVGSSLIFSCESVMLFDEGQRGVTFDELQEISRRYWNFQ
jgi:hypothetical protein